MSVPENTPLELSGGINVILEGISLIGRYDPSIEVSIVSYRFAELVEFEPSFIKRGSRSVMPACGRLSVAGSEPESARYFEIGNLFGQDILIGADLLPR